MFNPFKYVNVPLLIISWAGYGLLGFLVLPRFEPGSTGFVIALVLAAAFFISFAIQCMKGFFGIMRDAQKGAELREKEERENSRHKEGSSEF